MILYMDTSALIKRYIEEAGSEEVVALMHEADMIGTALITRVEMAGTITRAMRGNRLPEQDGLEILQDFRSDWSGFQLIHIDHALIARADSLASIHGLRGYDAVHLACALTWQGLLDVSVKFATYDRELHEAAKKSGFDVFPQEM
jgi:predicted nucleic acid-binding protein